MPLNVFAASSVGTETIVLPFSQSGALTATSGTAKLRLPIHATVVSVAMTVGTAPTGASLIVDVNRNGTTLFAIQSERPTIAVGQTVSAEVVPVRTALAAGDTLSVDVDQIGSTVAGADMTVTIYLRKATSAPPTYTQVVQSTAGLLSHWRLGEASGTVAADSFGANTGTYEGSPTLGQAGLISGDVNTAVVFDGVNDRMFTPSINLSSSVASMECWANVTAVNANTPYVSTIMGIQPAAGNEFQIRLGGNGVVGDNGRLQMAGYASGSMTAFATGNLSLGVRHHLVVTFSAGTMILYLDGVVAATNSTGGFSLTANGPLQIGGNATFGDDRWLDGKVDEPATYTTTLDLATVRAHYAAGF